jgi:hypothetical protein
MIRWFCSFFLEDHLPVAGVLQQADGSSRQPPADAFQPLHVLLQQAQQGSTYMPHNAMPAGRASASQLLLAMPASPPPRHITRAQHQQQQDGLTLPRCKAGLPVVEEGLVSAAAAAACSEEPALPISTLSSEPAATPTGRHAVSSSEGGGTSSWGSAGGFSPPQQQQQLCDRPVIGLTSSGSSSASGLVVQQQMAARLRDAARLEASPMRSAVASPVVGQRSSGNAARLAPGSLSFDAHTGSSKLSSKAVISNSSSCAVEGASRSSGSGWGIQAVQDALGSVGSAVEGLAMQVAEGLDSLDSMANAAAAEPAAEDVEGGDGGVAAEGSSSALDFVADFPQLFPAAVMSDVVQQRHSAAESAAQQQEGTAGDASSLDSQIAEPGLTAAASGAVADMSEFAAEAVRQVRSVVAAAQLPGVWRVESLHQMLRAVSPEPASRTAAAGKGKH